MLESPRKILVVLLWVIAVCDRAAQAQSPTKPNIVFILADDLGYGNIGVQGAKHPTPNLHRMAREGVRLTNFYTAGNVCTPTRSSADWCKQPGR